MYAKRGKRAFTLVELVVTIALFALVAGMVIGFVSFMTSYNRKNSVIADRTSQINYARKEIDYWFSCFDTQEYTIVTAENKVTAESTTGASYSITFTSSDESGVTENTLLFTYPTESNRGEVQENCCVVTVDVSILQGIRLTKYTENYSTAATYAYENFRFVINLPVKGLMFACDLLY